MINPHELCISLITSLNIFFELYLNYILSQRWQAPPAARGPEAGSYTRWCQFPFALHTLPPGLSYVESIMSVACIVPEKKGAQINVYL